MTADWANLPHRLLGRVANRIINEMSGVITAMITTLAATIDRFAPPGNALTGASLRVGRVLPPYPGSLPWGEGEPSTALRQIEASAYSPRQPVGPPLPKGE